VFAPAGLDQWLEVGSEPVGLGGTERLREGLGERGDQRVPRGVGEAVPAQRRQLRLDVDPQLQVDLGEAGLLGGVEQVALVEVEHRVGVGRL
jgi:hypothetical protein